VNDHCHGGCYSTELLSCVHPHFLYNKVQSVFVNTDAKDTTIYSLPVT